MNTILVRAVQVAVFAVLLIAGCDSAVAASTSKLFSNCYSNTNPGNSKNYFGNFVVSTDIWNPSAATSYSECVNATIDLNLGVKSAQFDWTFVSNNQVIAYPNLQFGQQPGWPTSTTTKLPVLVSSMPNLNVTGTINTTCATGVTCYFDSGFDLFFSNTATHPTYPPKIELMIWTEYNVGYQPSPVIPVTIGGTIFNVSSHIVRIRTNSWTIIEYRATTPITQLNLNIKNFVDNALARGYVASTDYLDVVEIGTEVRSGQGSTVITNYNIQ
jgi:hypothetical protein